MRNKIIEQIREKTIGASKDTQFDIREIETNYKIPNVTFLKSSYQFLIDPTPWDNWIVENENVIHGREIMEFIKNKNIIPKNKKEALDIAKLILMVKESNIRIYPEFSAKNCKKPKIYEKNGVYEIILYISYGFNFQLPMPIKIKIKLGKGICKLENLNKITF